ncbi:hypothetical protein B0A52_01137 [Exophiala mesophila]|uniref:OTU domain-containing protein n=1 Tax=Exophiala mesophila TaxID=212818 RepID=A0A438NGK6_EXOME|nr:hypothetical protein B0A52_01137 [Exophiala mesophila]
MEELLAKHRKEKRDLQSKVTQKKKNATKKTRKGINDECERLESDLKAQQQAELEALQPSQVSPVQDGLNDLSLTEPPALEMEPATTPAKSVASPEESIKDSSEAAATRVKKPNRQKARLARRAADQEAEMAAAAEEAAALPDLREQELSAMRKHMKELDLTETLIRPDGHCLFSACAHGIPNLGPGQYHYQKVRSAAASFMAAHPDDFSAFLEEPLDSYITKIRDTAEWGGQLELQAIARSYHIDINVLQADGRVEKVTSGEDKDGETIWLAYYRHSFGLGEHYNALKKKMQP